MMNAEVTSSFEIRCSIFCGSRMFDLFGSGSSGLGQVKQKKGYTLKRELRSSTFLDSPLLVAISFPLLFSRKQLFLSFKKSKILCHKIKLNNPVLPSVRQSSRPYSP